MTDILNIPVLVEYISHFMVNTINIGTFSFSN